MSAQNTGRNGTPKPPDEIWEEMGRAAKAGDKARLALAGAAYTAWLHEQGYWTPGAHGTTRPDTAIR